MLIKYNKKAEVVYINEKAQGDGKESHFSFPTLKEKPLRPQAA